MKHLSSLIFPLVLVIFLVICVIDKEGWHSVIPKNSEEAFKELINSFKADKNRSKPLNLIEWNASWECTLGKERALREFERDILNDHSDTFDRIDKLRIESKLRDLEWENNQLKRNLNNFRWNRDLRSFDRDWRDFDTAWDIRKLKRNLKDIEVEWHMRNLSGNKTLGDMNIELGLRDMERDLNNLEWEMR